MTKEIQKSILTTLKFIRTISGLFTAAKIMIILITYIRTNFTIETLENNWGWLVAFLVFVISSLIILNGVRKDEAEKKRKFIEFQKNTFTYIQNTLNEYRDFLEGIKRFEERNEDEKKEYIAAYKDWIKKLKLPVIDITKGFGEYEEIIKDII